MKSFIVAAALVAGASAQSSLWGQCGGIYWNGPTTCASGSHCEYQNDWYSQCLPGDATTGGPTPSSTTTTTTTTTPSSSPTGNPGGGGFRWFGVDESVAEFGEGNYPGVWGTHFRFPDTNAIQTLISQGYNMFRIPFSMERMAQTSLTGTLDAAYLQNLTEVVDFITARGSWAVLDPHNYGRYFGNIITNPADFEAFWSNLAFAFKDDDHVVFDTNEYHDLDQGLVFDLNQAAIDGIRGVGATSQYIFAEGNSWSGAWTWNTTNTNLVSLSDPQDKLVYEMHQYLDVDGSGTHEECVSTEVGVQRVVGATGWLRQNGKLGILGEFAGGPNSVCRQAITGMLDHLEENGDVWLGALWWSAGPWWGNYMYSFEPPSGTAYVYYNNLLQSYTP